MICALGENLTHEIDFSRHEDNLPSHGGRRLYTPGCASFETRNPRPQHPPSTEST